MPSEKIRDRVILNVDVIKITSINREFGNRLTLFFRWWHKQRLQQSQLRKYQLQRFQLQRPVDTIMHWYVRSIICWSNLCTCIKYLHHLCRLYFCVFWACQPPKQTNNRTSHMLNRDQSQCQWIDITMDILFRSMPVKRYHHGHTLPDGKVEQ